jgi:L-alanine-DL-glutamate epimerase-like enolase superfamily enzyme
VKVTGATASLLGRSATPDACCRIELSTDSGVTGVATGSAALLEIVPRLANELLIGENPLAIATHWQRLCAANTRTHGTLGGAVAALDCALWDLKARQEDVPLWRSLGALTPHVNVHARIALAVVDAAVASTCAALRGRGLRGVVLESTLNAELDARRVVAARAALGPEAALMLDLNEQFVAKDAICLIANLEHTVDLTWIEAPAARADFPGLKRVSDSIRGAVCAGAHFSSVGEYLPFLHARSLDIVQLDTARVGISGALQLADAAFGLELPVALAGSPDNLHVHLAAALPYCASVEVNPDLAIDRGVKLEHGWGVAA